MLQLEPGHRIVAAAVAERMAAPAEARESIDVRCSDFGALYHVCALPDTRHLLRVSAALECFEEVEAAVGRGYFAELYGGMLEATPEPGYSLTLALDLDHLPEDEARARAPARAGGTCQGTRLAHPACRAPPGTSVLPQRGAPSGCVSHPAR
jgi:actin related protein 2/3 complex subunit 2